MLKVLSILVAIAAAVFALISLVSLNYTYADGERAGYVQKFSRKGWVCKTWEGQMAMVTMPGTLAEKFDFTVRDPKVAEQINANIGERLALHYEQHRWIPTSCFGDTEYFVTDVKVVSAPAQFTAPQAAPPAAVPAPAQPVPAPAQQPPAAAGQ